MSDTPATAIVFSCDDAYVFLARGLVLSLAEAGFPNAATKVILVVIGCGPNAVAWMQQHGIEVVAFDAALIPPGIMDVIAPVQRAQVVRPWLTDLLPDFEHFIWLDCDLWVQNGDVVKVLTAAAKIAPDSVAIAPGNSHYNLTFYIDLGKLLAVQKTWFETCYEPDFAADASGKLHYSTGVFGLKRSSPIWGLWRQEMETLYPLVAAREPRLMHLVEQIALNAIIVRTNLVLRIDPLYNFHCNEGGAVRLPPGDRVVTNMLLPSRELGVIHLANWSTVREYYVKNRLLYRAGDYLSHAECASLVP
jgi:hypothetical protein